MLNNFFHGEANRSRAIKSYGNCLILRKAVTNTPKRTAMQGVNVPFP